ncbi:MAG: hypothetical protein WAW57_13400 [Lutibacter sp.]
METKNNIPIILTDCFLAIAMTANQKLFLRSISFGFHRLKGTGIENFSWYLNL